MIATSVATNRSAHFRAELEAAGDALGVLLTGRQVDQLLGYLDLLAHWNRTYNLTAVRDAHDMLTHHILDSLAALPAVIDACPAGRVLDVGSGGGLPGAVWAIAHPGFDVTCVDSVGKKAAFVRQAAAALSLLGLRSVHARVQDFHDEAFDLVTSRAFASLPDFVGSSAQVLEPLGIWVALKGKVPVEEMQQLPKSVSVFHVEPVRVPGLEAERCLVFMRKQNE